MDWHPNRRRGYESRPPRFVIRKSLIVLAIVLGCTVIIVFVMESSRVPKPLENRNKKMLQKLQKLGKKYDRLQKELATHLEKGTYERNRTKDRETKIQKNLRLPRLPIKKEYA